jgi:hypothetical protein
MSSVTSVLMLNGYCGRVLQYLTSKMDVGQQFMITWRRLWSFRVTKSSISSFMVVVTIRKFPFRTAERSLVKSLKSLKIDLNLWSLIVGAP